MDLPGISPTQDCLIVEAPVTTKKALSICEFARETKWKNKSSKKLAKNNGCAALSVKWLYSEDNPTNKIVGQI